MAISEKCDPKFDATSESGKRSGLPCVFCFELRFCVTMTHSEDISK